MAFTAAENSRIEAIEKLLNDLQTAVKNNMTKQQFNQLIMIKQKEVDALTKRIQALESQLTVLQNSLS